MKKKKEEEDIKIKWPTKEEAKGFWYALKIFTEAFEEIFDLKVDANDLEEIKE